MAQCGLINFEEPFSRNHLVIFRASINSSKQPIILSARRCGGYSIKTLTRNRRSSESKSENDIGRARARVRN